MFILFYSVVAKLKARNVKENSVVLCVAGEFFFLFFFQMFRVFLDVIVVFL